MTGEMSEHPINSDNARLATFLGVATVHGRIVQLARPEARPVGAVVVRWTRARPGWNQEIEQAYLASWEMLAQLDGYLHGFRELLPSHLADQWDARQRQQHAEWLRITRGRPS